MSSNIEFDIEYTKQDLEHMMFDTGSWWKDRYWVFGLGLWTATLSFLIGSKFLFAFAVSLFLIPALLYLTFSRIAKKSFEAPFFSFPLHVSISESGISSTWSEGSSTANWTQYVCWFETPNAFLLYQTKYTALPVPKRCLSSEQQESIRELVRANVVSRPSKQGLRIFTRVALVFVFIAMLFLSGTIAMTVAKTGHLPRVNFDLAILRAFRLVGISTL